MADDIDLHVGKRLRRRRRLLGMTQQELASQVGVRFQQIQKYECGANRITASRLYDLARAMNVTVQYFFDGMPDAGRMPDAANDAEHMEGDILSQKETLELVRAYYRLGERPRKRLLELAKALEQNASDTGAA
jgi:transcriptional regulator with XRE-family HTH domain